MCDIRRKSDRNNNNNHSPVVSIVLDVWQDKRLSVERTKIQADVKPAQRANVRFSSHIFLSRFFLLLFLSFSSSSLDGRQEQTSGWALTEFLKGYRKKRKIPTSDSCTRRAPLHSLSLSLTTYSPL